ncbi:MAG: Fe-S cluster assembly protein SufD [Dehalococcoidia bacterium]
MTERTATAERYTESQVAAASRERGEPQWLQDARAEAARACSALPMPTPALRPWRYTDLQGLDLETFLPARATVTVEGAAPAGGFAGRLTDASSEVVRECLGSVVATTEGKFIAANAAQWEDGVLVHTPRGQAFDQPVVVTVDASALDGAAVYPRLLVVAEERGEVTIVLRMRSGAAPLLTMGVVEVVAEQASRVKLLLDDQWGEATRDFTWLRARLAKDADLQVASVAMGAQLLKQTVEVLLEGEGATSVIRAVALGNADQHFDFVTLQDHIGPRTTSEVEVKSALAGASRSVYYGITRVGEGAQGANANQENKNLLLSGSAKADSDPVLEILTADVVRCGHGATVGPVDRDALFYLESRGLDRRQALQLLVAGFFQSVVGELPLEGFSEELEARVFAKLQTAEL